MLSKARSLLVIITFGAGFICLAGADCIPDNFNTNTNGSGELIELHADDDGDTVTISVAQVFTVSLSSNATTGYQWILAELDTSIVENTDQQYLPDPNPEDWDGVGGTEVWEFAGLSPGSTTLLLEYREPGETEEQADGAFEIAVVVEDGTGNTNDNGNGEFQLNVAGCPEGALFELEVDFVLSISPEDTAATIETVADNAEVQDGDTLTPTIIADLGSTVTVTFTATTSAGEAAEATCEFEAICLALCAEDAACDDLEYCNGQELCLTPEDGCGTYCDSGEPPCSEDEVCIESTYQCEQKCDTAADCGDSQSIIYNCADHDGDSTKTCQLTEYVGLVPEEATATDITLTVYSNGWGTLLETRELATEGEVTIDIEEEEPYGIPPNYYIYAQAEGFYTELYFCDQGETITVDLDGVPEHADAIAGVIFANQSYFSDEYVAEQEVTIVGSDEGSATIITDQQGRFGLGGLSPGTLTLSLLYQQFEDYDEYLFSFEITNDSGTDYNDLSFSEPVQDEAPYLYLYPEVDMDVQVELGFLTGGFVTESEPPYEDGWNLLVTSSGMINSNHEYLFYEALVSSPLNHETGWLLSGLDLEGEFRSLLKQLGHLGREIDDFVDFWVPVLEGSPWYAVYPQDAGAMISLNITPEPDSVLRTLLLIRALDKPLSISAPLATKPFIRQGFTVVEWGVIR